MTVPVTGPANAITVDVEDYFQVQAFAGVVDRADWDGFPSRVAANTARMLDLFAAHDVRGTFFTLGWVADRHPDIVRRIVAEGHELASHGYGHARVDSQSAAEFRADIARAKAVLEDVGGVGVAGYRAPTFSIGPRTPWAADMLAATGHRYSSSIYPVRHDLYGTPDAPRFAHRAGAIWEIPMTTLRLGRRNWPISGGGYFRLLPYAAFRAALRRFHRSETRPAVFYIHPWEIDPGQPRIAGAARLSRFRHTVNLAATHGRIARLLRDFRWDRMDRVFADVLTSVSA
jgi:polysaccharide deacetylase family protein (PEP-CTERM system associated)